MTGKLPWYQAHCRCHWIAFFSMAIGVLNYPHLDWRFVSGDLHTVPVGFGRDGQPAVVMDILLFDRLTAEESIANTQRILDGAGCGRKLKRAYRAFVRQTVPALRALALRDQGDSRAEVG